MKRKNIKGLVAAGLVAAELLTATSGFTFVSSANAAEINSATAASESSISVNNDITTSAAVFISLNNTVSNGNNDINIDDIYISQNNYSENMKSIAEPYINSRMQSGYIDGIDNAKLYYEKYACDNPVGNVVICHGFTESLEKYHEMIYYFLNNGYNVFGIEHRGHGRSGSLGVADETQIYVNDFNDYVNDFKTFMDEIVMPNSQDKKVFLYAHSMGGGIGAKFLEDDPQYFDASVLSSPMLEINTGKVPESIAAAIAKGAVLTGQGGKYVSGQGPYSSDPYDPATIGTSCIERYEYIDNIRRADKQLQRGGASYKWLDESLSKTKQITSKKNASKVQIPVLLFQAGKDTYVRPNGQNTFAKYAKDCTIEKFDDSRHEIYLEKDSIQKPYLYKVFKFYKDNL